MTLRPDEMRWLEAQTERCETCFHLKALHNSTDDGESCNVQGCRCDDGQLPLIGPRCVPIHGPRTAPSPDSILLEFVEDGMFGWYRGFDLLGGSAPKIVGLSAAIHGTAEYGGRP